MQKKSYPKCKIERSDDSEIIETPVTFFWLDKEGILYSQPLDVERTEQNVRLSLDILKQRLGNRKVCMIIDTTYSPPYTADARNLIANEMPKILKAAAVLSCSAMGKAVGNMLFLSRKTPYPVKMFDDPEKARKWVKQYM